MGNLPLNNAPYAPSDISTWYNAYFNYGAGFSPQQGTPLRPLLTWSNPVSNAIAARFGNVSAPPVWSATVAYQCGDWVIGPDKRSYICILPNTCESPIIAAVNNVEYWTDVPWTTTPVKASANTATFEQLWLAYCHVMTDSQTAASTILAAQWLPPMSNTTGNAASPETQMSMFRSVIRDNRSWPVTADSTGRVQLTPMQMMQLRAALAAVNTLQLRNAPDIRTSASSRYVVSRHIVLAGRTGQPAYDVEVFGVDAQPYILAMYAYVGTTAASNFVAVQLVNPYPVPIPVTSSWSFATVDRTAMPSMRVTPMAAPPAFTIPAAIGNQPGSIVIEDGTPPQAFAQPASYQSIPGLATAIGKELLILRPRRFDGTASKTTAATTMPTTAPSTSGESFDESNAYDLVPFDQIDMTGTDAVPAGTNLYYRRAADSNVKTGAGATFAWSFVWPGRYNGYGKYNPAGPKNATILRPSAGICECLSVLSADCHRT